jgi:hypothetical protein
VVLAPICLGDFTHVCAPISAWNHSMATRFSHHQYVCGFALKSTTRALVNSEQDFVSRGAQDAEIILHGEEIVMEPGKLIQG